MSNALRSSLAALGLDVRGGDAAWAAFSTCGKYRYALGRSWQDALFPRPVALWVAHNPSTATESEDDPTIRREIAFSKREGFGELVKVNVMAWRATDKEDLIRAIARRDDIVGPANVRAIDACIASADKSILAWGKVDPRLGVITRYEGEAWCLGTNGDGSPRHPLYVAANAPLVRWP